MGQRHKIEFDRFRHFCDSLVTAIGAGGALEPALSNCLRELNALPPSSIVGAISAVRRSFPSFWSDPTYHPPKWNELQNSRRHTHETALTHSPHLAWIFLLHGDGFIREAALAAIPEAPRSPFCFTALTYALNDSVPEVRAAAKAAAQRHFPETSGANIVDACEFLFEQRRILRRWGLKEPSVLSDALRRKDVLLLMRDRVMTTAARRPVTLLNEILRDSALDGSLMDLATGAALAPVRARALQTLLRREARHHTGYTREWIDKRYGLERSVPAFESRALDVAFDEDALLLQCASDSSASVRRVVAAALIERQDTASTALIDVMRRYISDPSGSVRDRAKFFFKRSRQE